MFKRIWKYQLHTTDTQNLTMPVGAEILTVQTQNGPCLWVLVDPDAEMEKRTIETFGTGHAIPDTPVGERKYIGTYQLHNGALVFHVFELVL